MTSDAAEALATEVSLGHLRLKHRMIMAPMGDRMWTPTGAPKEGLHAYYLARARGGVSLITIGASEFHPGYVNGNKPCFSNDENLPALRKFTDAIHAEGVPMIVQLQHGGPAATPSVSPSGLPSLSTLKAGFIQSRALPLAEVEDMRERCIEGALRVQNAGFDGVQLAGQAGYLLGQFFSPRTNHRDDRYGGGAENRMRLAAEIVEGIRRRCGPAFAIGYALSADEFKSDGVLPEMCIPFLQRLQDVGLNYFDVRVGTHESFATSARASAHNRFQSRDGIWRYTALFKKALEIPVSAATHGCYDPARWDEAIANGEADIVQIGKPLLAEPELVNKVLMGRSDTVRPCVLCMHCLEPKHFFGADGGRTFCAVNPQAGAEWRTADVPAVKAKRVVIVGAGPAGLEAARVAARRGHQVTVLEREDETGGALRYIGRAEGGDVYLRLRDWLQAECTRAGAKLQLSSNATAASVAAAAPDVVLLASGLNPPPSPAFPGGDRQQVISVQQALSGTGRLGERVAVVGSGQAAVLAAGAIAAAGRAGTVTIVDLVGDSHMGTGLAHMELAYAAMAYLPGRHVKAVSGVRVQEVRERDIVLVDKEDGRRQTLKADCIVHTELGKPDLDLAQALRDLGIEVQVIGDAAESVNIADAIHDGARVARRL